MGHQAVSRVVGAAMEEAAASHLVECGYRVIERNYHSRFGEIDIVAADGDTLVFVEVKYRKTGSLVSPLESLTREKAHRIRLTVRQYLGRRGVDCRVPVRVDLCVVTDNGRSLQVLPGVVEF